TSDVDHCGACTSPCATVAHASVRCVASSCVTSCAIGYVASSSTCDAAPPRLVAPLSTSTVTTRRPTLRWLPASGADDAARVELCADRACATVLETLDVAGHAATPTMDLPVGVVFWRVHGVAAGVTGAPASATWELFVGPRSTPVDTAWGTT